MRKRNARRRTPLQAAHAALLGLALCAPPLWARQGYRVRIKPEDVQQAIKRGQRVLLARLKAGFSPIYGTDYRTLTVMALLNSGVSPKNPAVARTIDLLTRQALALTRDQYRGTYQAGLLLMLFSMARDRQQLRPASFLVRRLKRFQQLNGGWGDNSRTQFALLGLKAAEDMGLEVPGEVYRRARRYLVHGQNSDGGWAYRPGQGRSYGSMTAAGISGLYICGARLYQGTKACGVGQSSKRLVKGLEWLANHYSVRTNPGSGNYYYYYLYGLERIGVLTAQRTIGGRDWYREGAASLVRTQRAAGPWAGSWVGGSLGLGTEFAMLFLGKGSQPVAIQKLRYKGDWTPDPYDVKNLVEYAAKDLGTPMTFQVTNTYATAKELAYAPILYLQGRERFQFKPSFRRELKTFVDQGGFIFASDCCGKPAFDRAFRAEMKKIFPDAEFEPLPPDHPVYTAPHRLVKQEAFVVEGLNTGCRTSVLYARHDVCCGWGGCEGSEDPKDVPSAVGFKLGVNMIAYALGYQRLRDKLEDVKLYGSSKEQKTPRGALIVGQLVHNGEWNPDPASIPNLTRTLREQTGMKAPVAKRRVLLGADDPGEYPLLYITGHRAFAFNDRQIGLLRAYLDKGGFLFSDACCGKAAFDTAFRALCRKLYPNQKLERLPAGHAIFQAPYQIQKVKYKIWARQKFPGIGEQPYLEGITQRGRLRIVYSRFNLGCEWQGHTCPGCIGVKGQDAYRLAVNTLLYALSR